MTATADLIARAKQLAGPVASCVAARISPQHLTADLTTEQLHALVIVLADAVDPVRLRAVVQAAEDGPDVTDQVMRLRAAHALAEQHRKAGLEIPYHLRLLESDYHRARPRQDRRKRSAA